MAGFSYGTPPKSSIHFDYIEHIFTDFQELAGDRAFADDKAIVGGLARLDGRAVMVIGHQKGRTVKIKLHVTLVCQHLRAIVKHYV